MFPWSSGQSARSPEARHDSVMIFESISKFVLREYVSLYNLQARKWFVQFYEPRRNQGDTYETWAPLTLHCSPNTNFEGWSYILPEVWPPPTSIAHVIIETVQN